MTELDGIRGGSPGPVRGHRAVVRRELERFLAIRHTGDVLLGGASGAGSLLLNTKASQEAACSRAPAAIVPGRVPELRDAGVSRFVGNGSYLAEADAAEGQAGWVEGPGSSEFAKNGSHLAEVGAAEGQAGWVEGPGSSGNAGTGSHLAEADAAEGRARQGEGPGSSGNAGTGSYLAGADVAEDRAGQFGGSGDTARPCARWQIST